MEFGHTQTRRRSNWVPLNIEPARIAALVVCPVHLRVMASRVRFTYSSHYSQFFLLGRSKVKSAGEVMLVVSALGALASLPYLLYWLLWLFTVWDLPPHGEQVEDKGSTRRRAEEAWALKTVGLSAVGVGIYRAIMFLAAR